MKYEPAFPEPKSRILSWIGFQDGEDLTDDQSPLSLPLLVWFCFPPGSRGVCVCCSRGPQTTAQAPGGTDIALGFRMCYRLAALLCAIRVKIRKSACRCAVINLRHDCWASYLIVTELFGVEWEIISALLPVIGYPFLHKLMVDL